MTLGVEPDSRKLCLHCKRPSGTDEFCCGGCRAIYQTIHGLGLSDFYRYRNEHESGPLGAVGGAIDSYRSYDEPEFCERHLESLPSGLKRVTLHLSGIHCAGCIWLVEKLPGIIPGVHESRLNFSSGNVTIVFHPEEAKLSRIAEVLHSLGYPSCALEGEKVARAETEEDRILLVRLGVAGFSAANTMLLAVSLFQGWFSGIEPEFADFFRWTSLILSLPAIFFSALPFYRAAFGALRAKRFHIDLPISLAILVSFALSVFNTATGREYVYFDSATALVFLLLAARLIQRRAVRRAREEARIAWSFMPSSARLVRGDGRTTVPLRSLRSGDTVEVLPGERFPSDGIVLEGNSSVDRSALTGESIPIEVSPGAEISGGTLNLQRPLQVTLTDSFASSRLGRLLEALAVQQRMPTPFLSFTEKISSIFVATVLVLAVVTIALRWSDGPMAALDAVLSLLIVTCPCALALASPLVLALAASRAARLGVLIKDADSLERLNRVKHVYFDKTGTLTTGTPFVSTTLTADGSPIESSGLLPVLVALAGATPSHPVSGALLRYAGAESERGIAPPPGEEIEITPGRGVSLRRGAELQRLGSPRWFSELGISLSDTQRAFAAEAERDGASVVILSSGEAVNAMLRLEDTLKASARPCVRALVDSKRDVYILSGDRSGPVLTAARNLGIPPERCISETYPEEKREILRADDSVTAMIGEGLNDGGALQAADVSIAVAGGIQPNLEAADIIIPNGDLAGVSAVFDGAHEVFASLKRILAVSALYNILGATLAMAGMMNPLIAAILMPLSSLTVISMALASDPFPKRVNPK